VRFTKNDCLVGSFSGVSDHRLVQLRNLEVNCIASLVNNWRFLKAFLAGLEMRRRVIGLIITVLRSQFASTVLDPETDLSCKVSIILLRLINMCKFSLILTYN